jgi:hypothetical protein
VESAKVTPTADHKYKVTLVVDSHKMNLDGSGNETPMKVNDLVDMVIFTGSRDQEKLNKLIDRNGDDNEMDVSK